MLLYLEHLASLTTYTLYNVIPLSYMSCFIFYHRKRIFILGPSHHVYLPDCALSSQTCYETPLYNLDIDVDSKDTSISLSMYPLVYLCIH